MTTYTFVPNATTPLVNWDDPTVWSGMVVPNAADADVVFPVVTTVATGSVYTSDVTIKPSEAYATRSVTDTSDNLEINGGLSVSGALTLDANTEIDLDGGNLSFGSLTSTGLLIEGSGQVSTLGILSNTQMINGSGLTITAGGLLNSGTLVASGLLTIKLTGSNPTSEFADGVITGGVYQVSQGGALILQTDVPITTIDATVEVAGGPTPSGTGDIQSYDPGTGSTLPLQQTLQTVSASGQLVVQGNDYTTSQALTDSGVISLQSGTLSTPGLTVTASGEVVGNGTLSGPIQNDGTIEATPLTLVLSGAISGTDP